MVDPLPAVPAGTVPELRSQCRCQCAGLPRVPVSHRHGSKGVAVHLKVAGLYRYKVVVVVVFTS